jgi:hypothetical protein
MRAFTFARLPKNAQTWEEEAAVAKQLLEAGLMIAPGKNYGGIDGQVGWVRMSFWIPEEKLREELERTGMTLGLEKDSKGK